MSIKKSPLFCPAQPPPSFLAPFLRPIYFIMRSQDDRDSIGTISLSITTLTKMACLKVFCFLVSNCVKCLRHSNCEYQYKSISTHPPILLPHGRSPPDSQRSMLYICCFEEVIATISQAFKDPYANRGRLIGVRHPRGIRVR